MRTTLETTVVRVNADTDRTRVESLIVAIMDIYRAKRHD
jgi:hypothetical protein